MEKNLIRLLSKGSKLINLYTGDVYKFVEQIGDSQFVKAVLQREEKWNKYKLIYEVEPEKEMTVDSTELVPGDVIPFISVKGKKLFCVRNMDIVTYTRNKETIKARVIYLDGGEDIKDAVFTFVNQDGEDISDTGVGYTAEQFANDYNSKNKAVKKISVEDGLFAEIDSRFNDFDIKDKGKTSTPKKNINIKKVFEKTYKPLTITGLRKRIKKLGFYYKDKMAYKKLSMWAIKVKKQTENAITEDFVRNIISGRSEVKKLDGFKYLEAYNIAQQLYVNDCKHKDQIELANIKRKSTIDVTEEEKAHTKANLERLEKEISNYDNRLSELDRFRKSILQDSTKEIRVLKEKKHTRKTKVRSSDKEQSKSKEKTEVA